MAEPQRYDLTCCEQDPEIKKSKTGIWCQYEDARARIVELEGENARLEELMRNLAEFIVHEVPPGFFKNGVEAWGMDEGEGRAYEFLDSLRFTPQGRFLRTRIPELEKELATLKAQLAQSLTLGTPKRGELLPYPLEETTG